MNQRKDTTLNPRRKPAQARSEDTVECILEATAHILRVEGVKKASTNRIAERAGVSIGSLYQYFPNKQALFVALARKHLGQMQALLVTKLSKMTGAPLTKAVPAMVNAMIDAHSSDPSLHCAISSLTPDLLPENEIHSTEQFYLALIKNYLDHHPDIAETQNTEIAAFILVQTIETLTHRAVLNRPDLLDGPEFRNDVTRLLLNYLQ